MRVRTGGNQLTALSDLVRSLRGTTKADAIAVINRDGGVVAAELPPTISQETFSIMCAAILGAGMTAATELGHASPYRVILESTDATLLIQEVGRRGMVVLVLPPDRTVSEIDAVVTRFAKEAGRNFE